MSQPKSMPSTPARARTEAALVGLALAVLSVTAAQPANAQKGPTLKEIQAQLESDDPATIQAGLESAGLLGSPKVIPVLAERVRLGLRPDLLRTAVDTLGVIGHPSAGPILFELVLHRRADVRQLAVGAVVVTNPPGTEGVLLTALGDDDPQVRDAAAEGLGTIGAKHAVKTLFLALDRGVVAAAPSIAQLGAAGDIEQLLRYLGKVPFVSMAPALTHALARTELPQATRLTIVTRLEELATPETRAFLETFAQSNSGGAANEATRRAARAAAERIVH